MSSGLYCGKTFVSSTSSGWGLEHFEQISYIDEYVLYLPESKQKRLFLLEQEINVLKI